MVSTKFNENDRASDKFSSIEWLTNEAVKKHKEGKAEEAIAFYLEALEIDNQQPIWVYGNVITLLAKLNRFEDGLIIFESSLDMYPESDEIYRAGGILWNEKEELSKGLELFNKALSINSKQPDWLYLILINQLLKNNELQEAITLGKESINLYPQQYNLYYSVAEIHERLGDIEEAISFLHKSISIERSFFWSNKLLGNLYLEKQNFSEATKYLYEAIKLNPFHFPLYDNFLESLLQQGLVEQAVAVYQEAVSNKLQSSDHRRICKDIQNNLSKRIKVLYDLLLFQIIEDKSSKTNKEVLLLSERLFLNRYEMFFWLADTLHKQNYWNESIKCYEKCLQLKPNILTVKSRLEEISNTANKASWINFEDRSIASQADLVDFYAGHSTVTRLFPYKVDIIVCVHNALEDVRHCLSSILCHTTVDYNLTVVDDGSEKDTQIFVKRWVSQLKTASLIRNAKARGYTKAANQGLKASSNDYAILLNSDTIVTPRWIEKMVECAESDSQIGIVGPLSNCASWQSVPKLFNDKGDWMVNSIPESYSLESYAELIENMSEKGFPTVSFVNGFCYMIKRAVIENIGFLDEQSFPHGYGEENDYSLRTAKAGFKLAIADNTYVYHSKSKSFGHQRRKELAKKGSAMVKSKHPDADIKVLTTKIKNSKDLINLRSKVQEFIENKS